jgi:CHAT domain-containing protein
MGGVYSLLGEEQVALDLHQKAADYFRAIGNKQGEAATLNGVARAFQNLNEYDTAYDYYSQALRLYQEIGNRDFTALNMFLVGRILYQKGDADAAFPYYGNSLNLSRAVGDQVVEAHALKGLGTIHFARGKSAEALAKFEEARDIYRKLGNRRSEAYVLCDIGHIYAANHDLPTALVNFQQALAQMRNTADRHGEALTLFHAAKAERDRGNLETAVSLIHEAIEIGESLRSKVNNAQLRTSFFTSTHDQYELYIDVLMLQHAREPTRGYAALALLASERARARSLLDSLLKKKIESPGTASVDLVAREQELLNTLDGKAESRTRLLSREHADEEVETLSKEIDALTTGYNQVRSELKAQNPRRALLIQPDQVRAEDLQSLLVGDDAQILEFALGDERSYLWLVSQTEITAYQLPGRSVIETIARRLREAITLRQLRAEQSTTATSVQLEQADLDCRRQAAALSAIVLGPVAAQLESKRLVVIGDGLLRHIPFEVLPLSPLSDENAVAGNESAELLIERHEVVTVPSALALAALRLEKNARSTGKTIAIFADPVFERDDPRVSLIAAQNGSMAPDDANTSLAALMRDFPDDQTSQGIGRLPSTLTEARAIMEFVTAAEAVTATGFAATRARLVNEKMGEYRILHLATHSFLNTKHPDLSGVVLSLVDERGQKVDGFLSLHDIYKLEVSSDLVVLSACRTALGKDVRGEGVVGLSSGFLYAGAKGVVASLWKVDDNTTAEFMRYFYSAMLKDRQPPATALRSAKLEMRKQARWQAPFYWAGFVIQGEYQDAQNQRGPNRFQLLLILTIAISLIGIYVSRHYWRSLFSR